MFGSRRPEAPSLTAPARAPGLAAARRGAAVARTLADLRRDFDGDLEKLLIYLSIATLEMEQGGRDGWAGATAISIAEATLISRETTRRKLLAMAGDGLLVRDAADAYRVRDLLHAQKVLDELAPAANGPVPQAAPAAGHQDWRVRARSRADVAARAAGAAVWEWDLSAQEFDWDSQIWSMLGLDAAEPPSLRALFRNVAPQDRGRLADAIEVCRQGLGDVDEEVVILDEGAPKRVRYLAEAVQDGGGPPRRIVGACVDVTGWRALADDLRRQRELTDVALAAVGEAVLIVGVDGRVMEANAAAAGLLGQTEAKLIGRPFTEAAPLEDAEGLRGALDPVAQTLSSLAPTHTHGDIVLRRVDGSSLQVQASARPMLDRSGEPIGAVAVLRDLSPQRAAERRLAWLQAHDDLTGLVNRYAFEERLAAAQFSQRPEGQGDCILIVDIERFKVLNDAVGHMGGDVFLREVAELLGRFIVPKDVLARLSGDQFAILLRDTGPEGAERFGQELVEAVADHRFVWRGEAYHAAARVGGCLIKGSALSPQDLIGRAELACQAAKSAGAVRILAADADQFREEHTLNTTVANLPRWIEEGRLVLFAQGIVSMDETQTAQRRFEVLVRLRGDDGELLSPAVFIPAAERFGMMGLVDRWVISEVLSRVAPRIDDKAGLSLAINLSANTLNDPSFPDFAVAMFKRSGLEHGQVTLEVTETAVLDGLGKIGQVLERLRREGFKVALDDFGAGRSSYDYLKNFTVDSVKIDGAFIRHMLQSPVDTAIVESINALAHRLNIETVAEYVEDAECAAALRTLGVDWAQGYLYGRPAQLEALLGLGGAAKDRLGVA
ncbi:EAL domain-containing protein [Caulobacter segnis]|uniref:EAL domain-containing protein n=1 Tax=Caulobacter segnis TaxID=88688 RepID=UPI00240F7CC3|nr:EAL domain-containing protein [Caulobacter segnis]MDG2520738.1 EAL domain-containing protein [Caulobacter segnis]